MGGPRSAALNPSTSLTSFTSRTRQACLVPSPLTCFERQAVQHHYGRRLPVDWWTRRAGP
jgi:hypothetical protein